MDIYSTILDVVESARCDFVGVADLAVAREAIREQGGNVIASFPRAVSIGIILAHPIVDQLPNRADPAVAVNYRTHAYSVINQRLDMVASQVASVLQQGRHAAFPVPAAERADDARICAVFSHKLAAHLAGLGWIGKSCLLITPEAGPRVRWASVLTDAPLLATGGLTEERCGHCTACVDICPVRAFTGRPFRPDEPRSLRYDAKKCAQYLENVRRDSGYRVCGLCLYACPYGRSRAAAGGVTQ